MTSVVVYIPARCVCAELMWTDPNSPVILVDLYCGLTVKWCKRYARYYEHYTDTVRDKNTNIHAIQVTYLKQHRMETVHKPVLQHYVAAEYSYSTSYHK